MIINPYVYATGGATDPYFANVVSLLHFDGTNGSTTFTDQIAARTWTAHGSAAIDTGQSVYGGASGLFAGGGSGAYISTPDHADWDFGSGSYTVECWFRTSAGGAFQVIFAQWDSASGNKAPFLCYVDNTQHLQFLATTTNASWDWFEITSGTISVNTWYHLAICRDGTAVYGYLDGVSVVTAGTLTGAIVNNSDDVTIACTANAAAGLIMGGYVDDFRATKGVARYPGGTTFTPPAVFPDS